MIPYKRGDRGNVDGDGYDSQTTPEPSMHSPMAGSTEGCTAIAAQQKNVKRPRCLHLLLSTKSKAKSSVTGRIRNRAAYLSSEIRAASSTPTLCTEDRI